MARKKLVHQAYIEAAEAVAESAPSILQPAQAKILPIEYYGDLAPVTADMALMPGVFDEGAMTVIYGASNSGKTFFAMDIALHIAASMRWRDRQPRQGAILYMAHEGGRGAVNRVIAWRMHHGISDCPFFLVRSNVNLLDPDADTNSVIATCKQIEDELGMAVKLIVSDTLARAMSGGNENNPEDMGRVVGNGDKIRNETTANLTWVHHSGKDEAKGARGHSSLRAATDTEIEVSASADGGRRVARTTKQREMESGETYGFSLRPVEIAPSIDGRKPVASCVVEHDFEAVPERGKRQPTQQAQAVFRVLADLINVSGEMMSGMHFPADRRCIHADVWREGVYLRLLPGDAPATKKQAFHRARQALMQAGLLSAYGDYVWVV